MGRIRRVGEVENDVFPIVFLCVPLCSCFVLPPTYSPKGVLFNAHVQHNVAWLVVSEIEAYLERIFLSYVLPASILSSCVVLLL